MFAGGIGWKRENGAGLGVNENGRTECCAVCDFGQSRALDDPAEDDVSGILSGIFLSGLGTPQDVLSDA
jgi:hypothetical protein